MLRKISGKNEFGFSLIELLIVLAIVAILASVAIPAYTSYQAQAKIKVAAENWDIAVRYIQAEIAKKSIDQNNVTNNALAALLTGNRKNPYNSSQNAFELGGIGANNGTVYINSSSSSVAGDGNFRNLAAGDNVTVAANVDTSGTGTDKTATLTVE